MSWWARGALLGESSLSGAPQGRRCWRWERLFICPNATHASTWRLFRQWKATNASTLCSLFEMRFIVLDFQKNQRNSVCSNPLSWFWSGHKIFTILLFIDYYVLCMYIGAYIIIHVNISEVVPISYLKSSFLIEMNVWAINMFQPLAKKPPNVCCNMFLDRRYHSIILCKIEYSIPK